MEWALMVVAIVAITTWGKIYRDKNDIRCAKARGRAAVAMDGADSARLRDEVRTLKERIAVLERITVEKENSLARQIDELRDR